MPFAGYTDFADCVAKNQDKDDPEAYCGSIKHSVEGRLRHRDFSRIYDEFIRYYGQRETGESEYYAWLKALKLDETKVYGAASESFRWAKDMLQPLREDADNKYYRILLGFPLKSMNGTVYKERDLIAAALSLKGKHPSLNHKHEFWFTPDSRYGPLTVVGAKYEDGAVEAILQVPKTTVCPVCNGDKMYRLIDNQRVVNVSLEGECVGGLCYDGNCEGFTFTDPPFTLLTSDVLPGIPLARIKPLENIMVEALHSSTSKKEKKPMVKAKARIVEDTLANSQTDAEKTAPDVTPADKNGQCPAGKIYSSEHGGCIAMPSESNPPTPRSTFANAGMDNTRTALGTAAAPDSPHFMRSGDPMGDKMKGHERLREEDAPERSIDIDFKGNDSKVEPAPPDEREGPAKTAPPPPRDYEGPPSHAGQPEGAPADLPKPEKPETETGELPPKTKPKATVGDSPSEQNEPDACPEGQHRDADGNCVPDATEQDEPCPTGQHRNANGECVPDEPAESLPSLEERRARIKAELKAKSAEEQAIIWEQKHNELYGVHTALNAAYKELKRVHSELSDSVKRERTQNNSRVENLISQVEMHKLQYNNVCGENTKLRNNLVTAREDAAKWKNESDKAWENAKKSAIIATTANEDYLEMARKLEVAEQNLTKARTNAKKTLKLRAS